MAKKSENTDSSDCKKDLPSGCFGASIPNDPHAVSVWLPTYQSVIDYEEVTDTAQKCVKSGYPRFVYHPFYLELCYRYDDLIDTATNFVRVFPSKKTSQSCCDFVGGGKIIAEKNNIYVCSFPQDKEKCVKYFWQHTGAIISSRQAEDILNNTPLTHGILAKKQIKNQLASYYDGISESDIYLYSNGMAAIFDSFQMIRRMMPDGETIQFGFPYLDTLKTQQKFGKGCIFLSDIKNMQEIEDILNTEKISAVFTEAPTNPLLNVIDFKKLKEILGRYNVPLIIDDTVGTPYNLDLTPYADIIVSSLTKFFCGSCVTMGGAATLNQKSLFYKKFKNYFSENYEDLFYSADANMMAKQAKDFGERMKTINYNAEKIADYLYDHPLVETVYYPKYTEKEAYDGIRKNQRGYGGLLSFVLKDGKKTAAFYDNLKTYKGPSLGTRFTLACLYTLIAHYHELDEVEAAGVSRDLIRISVGTEKADDLLDRIKQALLL